MKWRNLVFVLLFGGVFTVHGGNEEIVSLWVGRIEKARLLEVGLVKSADISAEHFSTIDDVIEGVKGAWPKFSVTDKQIFIISTLLCGSAEGGSLELLDILIGEDKDKALANLSIQEVVLVERMGISVKEAARITKLAKSLQTRRQSPARN